MSRIWSLNDLLGARQRSPAELVIGRCGNDETVDCWEWGQGAVQLALFLQDPSELANGTKKVRLAYHSFHPEPLNLTRTLECPGGVIGPHDPDRRLELAAGRSTGRRYRDGIVADPDDVDASPKSDAARVVAQLAFVEGRRDGAERRLSVEFPSSRGA
jgi:hypothetical protein